MKAEELMIGDWVKIDTPDRYAGAYGQIRSLFRNNENESAYFDVFIQGKYGILMKEVCSDDIRPILLSPEILENNDFKKFNFHDIEGQHQWSWWRDTLTSVTLWCRELNDDARDGWMIRIDSHHSAFCCKINYIHQLQHALQLCGINKEIKLSV